MLVKNNFGRVKPTFLIIGVQKGGTSSLHHYLLQHEDIVAPKLKELHYFDNFKMDSIQNYLSLFPKYFFKNKISFESTPRYIYFPGTAERIYKFNPKMKFIILLRNPVERAYSAWNMYRQMSRNTKLINFFKDLEKSDPRQKIYSFLYKEKFPTFEECVESEILSLKKEDNIEPSIVRRGYYKNQIEIYLQFFDKNQFIFIESDELKRRPKKVLRNICYFLNIKKIDDSKMDLGLKHKREYESKIYKDTYEKLYNHYLLKNDGLESIVGLNLNWMHK